MHNGYLVELVWSYPPHWSDQYLQAPALPDDSYPVYPATHRFEEPFLSTSLNILLPVHNAQGWLADGVARILDVLPELTHHFEIVIVDDGSTDDTLDVAHDLSTCFPQVRVVRHPVRLGQREAIQTGLDHSEGDIVFVGDEQFGLDPQDLRSLWQLRREKDLVMPHLASQPPRGESRWIESLLSWQPDRTKLMEPELSHKTYSALLELRVIERHAGTSAVHRVDGQRAGGKPQRPNYLERIRRFAWGE